MANTITWRELLDEIDQLESTGKPREGAFSNLGTDEPIRFFPRDAPSALSRWLHAAHLVATQSAQHSIVAAMDESVREWTHQRVERTLFDAGSSLTFEDFVECVVLEDGDLDFDPIDARYRLQCLIEEVLRIAKFASELAVTKGPSTDKEFWSRDEVADFEGVKPQTISKRISGYRRVNGRDPMWVRRLPGRKRGFQVLVKTYMSEMLAKTAR